MNKKPRVSDEGGEERSIEYYGQNYSPEEFRQWREEQNNLFVDEDEDREETDSKQEATRGSVVLRKCMRPQLKTVSTQTLLDEVVAFLKRFIFFKDESLYFLVANWIVCTHMYKDFEYTGYLFLYSPERQSGKTVVLEVLNWLAYRSTGLQVSPTEAVLFRNADGHTQLLDEADTWTNSDALRSVLNAGFKRGGSVIRMEKSGKGGFVEKKFPVYGPRAMAGIGLSILVSTTLDRTFAIAMVRRKRGEKLERFRERTMASQAVAVRKKIEIWVKANRKAVAAIYDEAGFDYLKSFSDRTIDITEPLAALVEVAYKEHPNLDDARNRLVRAVMLTREEQQTPSQDHELLKHLLKLAEDDDPLVGNASEIAAKCGDLEGPVDAYVVSRVLHKYGFKTKSIRKQGESTPLYRYTLSKSVMQELVDRWVSNGVKDAKCTVSEPAAEV